MDGLGGPDHARMQSQVERAHGRSTANWRPPFWLLVVGLVLAVLVLGGMVAIATVGS